MENDLLASAGKQSVLVAGASRDNWIFRKSFEHRYFTPVAGERFRSFWSGFGQEMLC